MIRFVLSIIMVLAITGCNNGNNTMTEQEKIAEELNPARNEQTPVDPEWDSRLGYVNYTKDQFNQDPERNHAATIDRNQMADMIARIILRNDAFEEIATLVTDQHVLIAYDKNEVLNANEAADFAKKSAMSILPRYFDVYVTDNAALIRDIQSLHFSTTKDNIDANTIDSIINEMKKSPQGFENNLDN